MNDIIQQWLDSDDDLTINEYGAIEYNGSRQGRIRGDNVVIGPDDGGVRGEPVDVDGEWLIVEGSQEAYMGPERGRQRWTGKFAVRPNSRKAEIDGPISE